MTQDELNEILHLHDLWDRGAGGARADLSGQDISNLNLSDAELGGAQLEGANMSGCDMRRAVLDCANLSNANMSGSDATEANMTHANMSGAFLVGARLDVAELIDANLSNANLSGASLFEADLTDACLEGANLTCADMRSVIIYRTDFSGVTWPDGKPTATPEQSDQLALAIAKVVLESPDSLNMSDWHCETAHCLAGWAETIVDGENNRDITEIRGHQLLPTLAHLFYSDNDEVLEVLLELVKE